MIIRADIDDRVRLWGLREDVVEKDYVLGWVLWGIGGDPLLHRTWVFKGGTCLKKCHIETYRFSEDLDFTVLEDGPIERDEVIEAISRVLDRVNQESGIDFTLRPPVYQSRPSGRSAEMRVYYRGPRNTPSPASIKFDLTKDEIIARPPVLRPISHDYPDTLPEPVEVRCYSFEEVFAEMEERRMRILVKVPDAPDLDLGTLQALEHAHQVEQVEDEWFVFGFTDRLYGELKQLTGREFLEMSPARLEDLYLMTTGRTYRTAGD